MMLAHGKGAVHSMWKCGVDTLWALDVCSRLGNLLAFWRSHAASGWRCSLACTGPLDVAVTVPLVITVLWRLNVVKRIVDMPQ